MKNTHVTDSIRKFFEEKYYLVVLAVLLSVKAVLDNPAFSGIIAKIPLLQSVLGNQSWEETLTTTVLMSITLGVFLNGRKLEQLDTSIVTEAKNFGLHIPRIQSLRQRDNNYSHIAGKVLTEQKRIVGRLADGVFSLQLELMERMQDVFMDVFRNRMDAASYDDLELWRHIHQRAEQVSAPDGKVFDSDIGRKYYNKILEMKELHLTVVTRILVLRRDEVQEDIETVARVVKQHTDDGIGVALAFVENLHASTSEWFNTAELSRSRPRIDFALFDSDRAVTFFRKNSVPQRFEAVVNLDDWGDLIDQQREMHKTLLAASVFATQQFYDGNFKETQFKQGGKVKKTVEPFYSRKERQDFRQVIDHIRSESHLTAETRPVLSEWEQMFSVTLSDAEYKVKSDEEQLILVMEKIAKSVQISKRFKDNVRRFTKLLGSADGGGAVAR